MAKPKLGMKRQCPKCGARFYDLGKDDPITCIGCEHQFAAEQILKPRRPAPAEVKAPEKAAPKKKDPDADPEAAEGDDADDDDADKDDGNLGTVLEIDDDDEDPAIDVNVKPETD